MILSSHLSDNEAAIRNIFANCDDFHSVRVMLFGRIPGCIAHLRVLVDHARMDAFLQVLTDAKQDIKTGADLNQIQQKALACGQAATVMQLDEAASAIAEGSLLIFAEGVQGAVALKMANAQLNRQIEEPSTETLIRGPHVGFIESIETNMALIRHKVRLPQLKLERVTVGNVSATTVVVAYIDNLAPGDVVQEMKRRLKAIDVDIIMESGQVEELIRDAPYSPFPVMQMSERPDTVAGLLLDGKVALLTDGSPMALIAPSTFWQGFQTMEDYYTSFIFATILRWLRFLFSTLALLLPSFYIAITTFHQEMIPTSLALSIASAREIAPFPALVETLVMEIAFEGLREAGIRLPRPVGQTISIVGALVIGEAAVQAGIISAPIVIIVSLTGIASFLLPKVNMSQAIRFCRFPMMLLAGTMGLYGLGAGMLALLIHLVNLRSFGVPYMTPVAPFHAQGLLDVFVRAPWRVLHKRQSKQRS